MLDFITSPLGQALGWLFGAVSLPLAIYFYMKQRVHHALSYDIFHRIILRPTKIGNVRVLANFGGHEASSLVETFLLLKNYGNQTIKKDEIVGGVQIKSNGTILNGQLIAKGSGSSNPVFDIYDSGVGIIDFNFLRPGESLLLRVLHTDPDLGLDVWAEGPYIGNLKYRPVHFRRPIFIFIALSLAILLGASCAMLYNFVIEGHQLSGPALKTMLGMVGLLFFLGAYASTVRAGRAERKFVELAKD
jgi:hypothetical protein